jgi:putative restriction endonuclease
MVWQGDPHDAAIRAAMFEHLDALRAASGDAPLHSADINRFVFGGRPRRLLVQTGIHKPADLVAALTIRTAYTPPNRVPPYFDDVGPEGLVRYKYRGTDPQHADNRALRAAKDLKLPLAYFIGIVSGVYLAQYPVRIIGEDPSRHEFAVAVDEGQCFADLSAVPAPQRAYLQRLTKARLHQPVFRARVIRAYTERCAMCRLRHPELLDAAHIIPDGQPDGDPVVPNGLSLCKIHHAAYDANLLGVRPDLVVEVQPRLLEEVDGPMLTHGLKAMAGVRLHTPRSKAAMPDQDRLEVRYQQFRAAS